MKSTRPLTFRHTYGWLSAVGSHRIKTLLLSSGLFAATALSAATDETTISQQEQDYARENLAAEKLNAMQLETQAAELQIRGGLPHFFKKVRYGKPVSIAYFGGSITAHEGWRPQTFKSLQTLFPNSQMEMIPAAVGGTGSIVGVFRADHDLIQHDPDLVFIEFAVNDGSDAVRRKKDVVRALEGIIRKIKRNNPETDICIFYTMQTAHVDTVQQGFYHPAAAVHEQVATYYNIPSIYVGPAVVAAIDAGKAVFKGTVADKATGLDADGKLVLTEDNTHPVLPTGHQFYADTVLRAIKTMAAARPNHADSGLPEPIYGSTWELAKTIPVHGHASFDGNWEKLTAADGPAGFRFGTRAYEWFPYLYRTAEPGASVTVHFKGTIIGLKGYNGPDSGIVSIKVDDQAAIPKNTFTVYSKRFAYIGDVLPELDDGAHTVTWTLSESIPDKGKILASYYQPDNDLDFREHPENYALNRYSVAQIQLIGEIIEH